jgi:hypothetical protein
MDWLTRWFPEQPVRRMAPVSSVIRACRIVILSGPDGSSVVAIVHFLLVHDCLSEPSPERSRRSLARALPRRDITVPMGQFKTSAISW